MKIINKLMSLGVIAGLLLESFPVWALSKDETIYAKLENNGQVEKVIVTEHLEGTNEDKTEDKTTLQSILNISGNEKFTIDDGRIIWESNGKDIYYQGTTDKELPISLKITYYLNGKETSVKDMLGKKGKVTIKLQYTNNDKHTIKVNGKNETLYTPFVVASTTIISNQDNKNISVTNGKVITNGTSSVITMISTPGLYESLGIDKLKEMDTATITYDTDSFKLSGIYSIATPKLIESSDLDIFDNIDKIYGSINSLSSSSNKLKNGSNEILNGANKLKDGVTKLVDGVNKLYGGSKLIKSSLEEAIEKLRNDNSPAIDNNTLAYIKNEAIANSKNKAIEKAKEEVNKMFTDEYKNLIATQAVEKLKENSTYQDLQNKKRMLENSGITPSLVSVCTGESIPNEYLETCINNKDYIAQYTTLNQMITLMEETTKQTAVETAYQTAITTSTNVAGSVSQEVAGEVSTTVAKQVAANAKEKAKETTISSLQTLLEALSELTSGLNELNTKVSELDTGTQQLKEGISSLDSGLSLFNSQGINKISSLVNNDVKTLEGKVKALGQLSIDYKTFDDIDGNANGSSKIIMIVDPVEQPANLTVQNNKLSEKIESLWDKIKELFKK